MRGVLCWLLVVPLWCADARQQADRAYVLALAAFQDAQVAETAGDVDTVRRCLEEAKAARAAALAAYRDLQRQPDAEVVERRRVELDRLGKECCGRRSLWERFGIGL